MTIDRRMFNHVSEVNRQRSAKWHNEGEPWSLADWSNALGGEGGELLEAVVNVLQHLGLNANIIKKIRRIQTGTHGRYSEQDVASLIKKAKLEIADVYLYLDLLLEQLDPTAHMEDVVALKFNMTSQEYGFEERL